MTNIFDRLFNKIDLNNSELAELIHTIKQSGKLNMLQEIISNVKEEYFVEDIIHGINHSSRVMILSAYIGIKEGLSDNEFKLLLYSALYHDIGRKGKTGKENHGSRSASLLEENKSNLLNKLNQDEIDIIKALCIVHSTDDKKMQEIAIENGVKNITSFIKVAQILKDADALDRVRLPKYGKLNERYLRTYTSKKTIEIARELFFETTSVNKDNKKNNIRLENEDYIFLFRSLTKEDVEDRKNGYKGIRPNILRKTDTSKTWEAFKNRETLIIDELYKHVRKQFGGRYTNCISLTEDANVCLTYYPENEKYVIIRIPKNYENSVVHVGRYFIQELNKLINSVNIDSNIEIKKIFDKIENARSNEELEYVLKRVNEYIPSLFLTSKQYLEDKEELDYHKVIAKIKILEEFKLIDNIIDGIENEFLNMAIFNSFSSAEYVHYGEIDEENVIECPKEYMDILTLIQQAKFNGIENKTIQRITNKVIKLIQDGYKLENSGVPDEDIEFLYNQYSKKDKLNDELNIDMAYNLSNGEISFTDTLMQITAIRLFAESLIRKRVLLNILKKVFPEEKNLDSIFEDTYCLNPEISTRQNGRGTQISNSVNVLVTEKGVDFGNENIKRLLENVSKLSNNQLQDIYLNGINSEVLKDLLMNNREGKKRIVQYKNKTKKAKYIAEAIIEGYDWKKVRGALTKTEKSTLAKTIINHAQRDDLERLFSTLQEFYLDDEKLTKEEIYAVIINLAIGKTKEKNLYKKLLKLSREEQKNELEQNSNLLQTSINPIAIDILMKRGKSIERIKQSLLKLGITEEFIDKKDLKNLYTAHEIVKKYDWRKEIGRKLSNREKSAIIQILLSNSHLDIEGTVYLTCLMNKLESIGLSSNEINGYIINLAVNKALNGAGYTNMINGIIRKKDFNIHEEDKHVSEITILKAVSETLSKNEQQELKEYFKSIGITDEHIESEDIRNLYVLNEIIKRYKWKEILGRDIEKEEINGIISLFNMGNKHGLLSNFMHKLEEKHISEQEVYSVIINLIINNTLNGPKGYNSTFLFSGFIDLKDVELTKENKTLSKSTILKARSKNFNREDVIEFVNKFGNSNDFISKKKIDNVITAYEIVQNFDWENRFGRELSEEEKFSIIKSILTNKYMDNKNNVYLTSLIKKMEALGIDEQDTYGIIINLGINGGLKDRFGYDYNSILAGQINVKDIEFNEEDKTISEMTVLKSRSETLSMEQKEDLKNSLELLGIHEEFLVNKDFRNLFVIYSIIERYDWEKAIGRKLNKDEKRLIFEAMLSNNELNKGKHIYLIKELQNLEFMGLSEQEIYAAVINFAINSRMNFSYGRFVHGKLDTKNLDLKDDDKNVSELGILRAKSELLRKEEQESLIHSLTELGIPIDFLETKDIKNVYIINYIIEKYNWHKAIGRNISLDEKGMIIHKILTSSVFNKRQCSIKWLIRKLEARGLKEQEIYGFILNRSLSSNKNNVDIAKLTNGSIDIEKLEFSKNDFKISNAMLLITKSEAIKKDEQEELLEYLTKIGVSSEILRKSKIGNIYLINQMVQAYNWEMVLGRDLKNNERTYIIQSLLNNSTLRLVNISYLIGKLDLKGLSQEEIYGLILNAGINNSINGKKNCCYSNLLGGITKIEEMQFSDVDKKVGLDGALRIKSETMDKDNLINYLQGIGISNEFLQNVNIYDVSIAKEIVEGYNWEQIIGRNINNEEKRGIIQSILSECDSRKPLLIKLIQKLMLKGMNEQRVYGTIINLALKGMIKNKKSYGYKYLIKGPGALLKAELDDEDMVVTEETLKLGIINVESLMKKMLVKAKENETLYEIPRTIEDLIRMNKQKKLEEQTI